MITLIIHQWIFIYSFAGTSQNNEEELNIARRLKTTSYRGIEDMVNPVHILQEFELIGISTQTSSDGKWRELCPATLFRKIQNSLPKKCYPF